jgi:hypothetical protein
MARQLRTQLEQEVRYDPLRDDPADSRMTPRSPPPAAVITPAPDAKNEPGTG